MHTTAELRWFVQETVPESASSWFHETDFTPASEARRDRYLLFPGCTSVGVKLRDDALLDIKAIRDAPQTVSFANGVVGRTDTWVKWSAKQPLPRDFFLDGDSQWIDVAKRRWTRRYSVAGEKIMEVSCGEVITTGCAVELAEITCRQTPWWTLALEAFGPPRNVARVLAHTAAFMFQTSAPPVTLTASTSFSYPFWLAAASPYASSG